MHETEPNFEPLFRRAFQIVDGADDEELWVISVRADVARLAQQVGLASVFDQFLDKAITAWETLQTETSSAEQREEQQQLEKSKQAVMRRLIEGDLPGAEEEYLAADGLREDWERGREAAYFAFLEWLLEAADLARCLRILEDANWLSSWSRARIARRLAKALNKDGHRSQALNVLRNLRSEPDVSDAPATLSELGEALWDIGEAEEGIAVLREAARLSLAKAKLYSPQRHGLDESDPHRALVEAGKALWKIGDTQAGITTIREAARLSLDRAAENDELPLFGYGSVQPISLAQLQCTIGDHEGAIETLDGVLALAVPIEYDPPQRPPDLPANALYIAGHTLKPASERWIGSLPDLIRILARAGRDDEALALVESVDIGQLKLLAEVMRGQARRGAYDEAFRTLAHMRTVDFSEKNEPSRVRFNPDGTIDAFHQTSPIRPVEPLERKGILRSSLHTLRLYAADAGDADTFRMTDRLLQEYPDPHSPFTRNHLLPIDLLLRRGNFDEALASVESTSPPRERLIALRHVMNGIVKGPKPSREDILSNAYR